MLFFAHFTDLDEKAEAMVQGGLRVSTQRSYKSVHNKYFKFCSKYGLSPVPTSEMTLLRFIAFLRCQPGKKSQGLSLSSIQVSLSAIRSLHSQLGIDTQSFFTPRVKLALRSVALNAPPPSQKLPITFDILCRILPGLTVDFDGILWFVVIVVGYMGAMRGSEYTCLTAYKSGAVVAPPLALSAVSFGRSKGLDYMQIKIPRTKTSIRGTNKVMGCTKNPVCAVCSMRRYLAVRAQKFGSKADSPLFFTASGRVVSKSMLDQKIKHLVTKVGLDPTEFTSHSLRSGAASTGAANGLNDFELMQLGSWSSQVFVQYIRKNIDTQAKASQYLVT